MTKISSKATINIDLSSIISILTKSIRTFSLILMCLSFIFAFGAIYLKHLIVSPIKTGLMTIFLVGIFIGVLLYTILNEEDNIEDDDDDGTCNDRETQNNEETENKEIHESKPEEPELDKQIEIEQLEQISSNKDIEDDKEKKENK